jgi:hypothetical protein
MKVLVKETQEEGLLALLGKRVTLYCVNYIYAGTLVGVNSDCIKLEDAELVYETGTHESKSFSNTGTFPNPVYVQKSAIEIFTEWK